MVLRHRDRELIRFEWIEPEGIRVLWADWKADFLFPLEFGGLNGDGRILERRLESWLKNRTAPMGRHYIRHLLAAVGIDARDPDFHRRALDFSKGLSLNDVYWVTPDDFGGNWNSCNLYANEFSKALAEIAFSGNGELGNEAITTSPEMTTNGMLPKCWRRVDGRILLYKSGVTRMQGEPYSEYYAAQIADAMGFEHVSYDLARYKGRLCSTCPLFTGEKIGYVPASRFLNRKLLLSDPAFAPMFLFDAVVFNTDRHFGNFGYLVDNDTNRILGPAPIFDNGYGLFSMADTADDIPACIHGKHPALFDHWMDVPGGVTDELLKALEKLKGFRFARHHHYNLPGDRLAAIEKLIQKRIGDICRYREKADEYLDVAQNDVLVNTKNGKEDVRVNIPDLDSFDLQLLWNMKANSLITEAELASGLGRDERTIRRRIKSLKESGLLLRKGSDKKGSWEVTV